jgi:adenine phosphoribosyltransferase
LPCRRDGPLSLRGEDAVLEGECVLLVDDLVATGGAAEAACKLLKQIGAKVLAACFIIDLPDPGGAEKIRKLGVPVRTLVSFEGALADGRHSAIGG